MNQQSLPLPEIVRHLPPSTDYLRLLDWSDETIKVQAEIQVLRPDVQWVQLPAPTDSVDGIISIYPEAKLEMILVESLRLLRAGGRLLFYMPPIDLELAARQLEKAGYVRILAEAIDGGVLCRGEKPHPHIAPPPTAYVEQKSSTATIPARSLVQGEAVLNVSVPALYLLIRQTPYKPAWQMAPDEVIQWQAVALNNPLILIAFSGLPRAVELMQTAIVQGFIQDVHKIAKFSKATLAQMNVPVWINPSLESLRANFPLFFWEIDPRLAEAPDE